DVFWRGAVDRQPAENAGRDFRTDEPRAATDVDFFGDFLFVGSIPRGDAAGRQSVAADAGDRLDAGRDAGGGDAGIADASARGNGRMGCSLLCTGVVAVSVAVKVNANEALKAGVVRFRRRRLGVRD